MPTRLIEIIDSDHGWRLQLQDTNDMEMAPYIILSYYWGGDQVMKSTTELTGKWLVDILFDIPPKTIQDSVTECQCLGIRFLLTDCLCII